MRTEIEGIKQFLLLFGFLLLEQQNAFDLADVFNGATQFVLDRLRGCLLLCEFLFLRVVLRDQLGIKAQHMCEERLPVSMCRREFAQLEHITEIILRAQ